MFLLGRQMTAALTPTKSTPAQHCLYVLKTINIIPLRMNTYSVVEAALKTRHFNSFVFRTYENFTANSRRIRTYKKGVGVGVGGTIGLLRQSPRLTTVPTVTYREFSP